MSKNLGKKNYLLTGRKLQLNQAQGGAATQWDQLRVSGKRTKKRGREDKRQTMEQGASFLLLNCLRLLFFPNIVWRMALLSCKLKNKWIHFPAT